MTRESSNTRSWYIWALIAFIVGLVLGLIIAWGIWPVSYQNALPQDLRSVERDHYLRLVASSYAATGDLLAAQARLETWPTEDLAEAAGNLQERLLGSDPEAAADVRDLVAALNLRAAASRPAAQTATPFGGTSAWKSLCTSALWVLLLLLGVAGLAYLFKRWRAARQRRIGPAIASTAQAPASSSTAAEIARQEKDEWPSQGDQSISTGGATPSVGSESYLYDGDDEFGAEPPAFVSTRTEPPPPAPVMPVVAPVVTPQRPPAPIPAVVPQRPPGPAPVASGGKVGDYMAIFQMGEPDYDEAFDINDPTDGYMGQCGLQLNDPAGRSRDQALALQAWLWDSSDPDTRTKVLMGEGTYRDTALRSQHAGEHEALQVRTGAEFELETHDLLLRGRVEKADFTDQEPYRGVFAELQVRMQIYRKS